MKRQRDDVEADALISVCSFYGTTPAAVSIRNGKTKLCLLHCYTMMNSQEPMEVLDPISYDHQSPAVQELFARV
jgi:hypothetical protein